MWETAPLFLLLPALPTGEWEISPLVPIQFLLFVHVLCAKRSLCGKKDTDISVWILQN